MVDVRGEGELLEVVLTLQPGGRLPDFLHGGQKEADEDCDDGNYHEQFDQGEGVPISSFSRQQLLGGRYTGGRESLTIARRIANRVIRCTKWEEIPTLFPFGRKVKSLPGSPPLRRVGAIVFGTMYAERLVSLLAQAFRPGTGEFPRPSSGL